MKCHSCGMPLRWKQEKTLEPTTSLACTDDTHWKGTVCKTCKKDASTTISTEGENDKEEKEEKEEEEEEKEGGGEGWKGDRRGETGKGSERETRKE